MALSIEVFDHLLLRIEEGQFQTVPVSSLDTHCNERGGQTNLEYSTRETHFCKSGS